MSYDDRPPIETVGPPPVSHSKYDWNGLLVRAKQADDGWARMAVTSLSAPMQFKERMKGDTSYTITGRTIDRQAYVYVHWDGDPK